MARAARDTKLDTRTARAKLTARRNPYWRTIGPGQQVGYLKGKRTGSWTAKYRDPDTGERYQRKLGTADDHVEADGVHVLTFYQAQEAARAFVEECRRVEPDTQQRGPYTVRDAVNDYLQEMRARGAKSVGDTQSRLNTHVLPELGNVEVYTLTAAQLRRWHRQLASTPAKRRSRPGDPPKYAEPTNDPDETRRRRATANRVLAMLKGALNHAWREGKVASDDAWRRVQPFKETDQARTRYLSNDEITRLVNACEGGFRRLVQGALYTGARYGELTRMRVDDFNSDAGTVTVRASKSGKPRHVVLTDNGAAFFETMTAGRKGDAPIFVRDDSAPWGAYQQRRPMIDACQRAKIKPAATFHTLRHTYASHLAMQGVPLAVIASNLGHTDQRMVEKHYGHLAPSYVADTIRRAGLGYDVPEDSSNVERLRQA